MVDVAQWATRIRDQRSRRVVFVAHCLLNENTRYLGGARYGGAIREIVQFCLDNDIGIVQLPCPEQHAWGGVLKSRLLFFYGSEGKLRYQVRGAVLPLLVWYTRRIYRRLARQTAAEIEDYQKSGFVVVGIIGVDASPTCGVTKSLDMKQALARIARLKKQTVTAEEMNAIVSSTVTTGRGLYIDLLQEELTKRRIRVPFAAHDLLAELKGERSMVDMRALLTATRN
jgi:predicted secreted protein